MTLAKKKRNVTFHTQFVRSTLDKLTAPEILFSDENNLIRGKYVKQK